MRPERPHPHLLGNGFPAPTVSNLGAMMTLLSSPSTTRRRAGGGNGPAGEAIDPAIQKQYERATLEYRMVRRYKNPLADAVARLGKRPGGQKLLRLPAQQAENNKGRLMPIGLAKSRTGILARERDRTRADEGKMGLSQSLKEGSRLSVVGERQEGRRGRNDTHLAPPPPPSSAQRHGQEPRGAGDGDTHRTADGDDQKKEEEGEDGGEAEEEGEDSKREEDPVLQILRRMWELAEPVEGGGGD